MNNNKPTLATLSSDLGQVQQKLNDYVELVNRTIYRLEKENENLIKSITRAGFYPCNNCEATGLIPVQDGPDDFNMDICMKCDGIGLIEERRDLAL